MNCRPSSLHRRSLCAGSARLESQCPEPPDSEWSAEGRLLHRHFADKTLDRSGLSEEHRELLETADALQAEVIARVEKEMGCAGEDYVEFAEQELRFFPVRPPHDALFSGTPDYRRLIHGGQIVIDLKMGFLEVTTAEANEQLAAYSVAAFDEDGGERIFCAIIQPRLSRDKRITMAVYDAAQIPAVRAAVAAIDAATNAPDAALSPSEDACRYCAAKLACPAFTGAVRTLATLPAGEALKSLVSVMPAEELGKLADCIKLARLETFGGVVMDQVMERCKRGEMPEWFLSPNGATSDIASLAAVYSILTDKLGVSADEFLAICEASIKGLRDLVRAKLPVTGNKPLAAWKDVYRFIDDNLAPYITKTEKAPTPTRRKG